MKQQIVPLNLTREIIDETAILYKEDPIYQVVDEKGEVLQQDQKLWEKIQKDSSYTMFMDKVDRWTKLLGTVLVKVSFVDPDTGNLVQRNEGGQVHLDVLHGGVYDLKHGASPYYITELLIGFGSKFSGFSGFQGPNKGHLGSNVGVNVPDPSSYGPNDISVQQHVGSADNLGPINRIYWSPDSHRQIDEEGNTYNTDNPYGVVPAVPFFNQDPAHYYFLPINEPLIYANHALNMRLSDLNHIAKFQSFGVPVVSGVERPTSTRQGRPVDDFNQLKGGSAQSRFGGLSGFTGFGAGGSFRTFDGGLGMFRDGNADANALGMSMGPDTAVSVGEKGDFKFAHPNADINGLTETIKSMSDMVRINHGLRPKFQDSLPASGFAKLMDKLGVIEENQRRSKLFEERERQLFQVIKHLWNTHHRETGAPKFSEGAELRVTYKQPEFPVDPKTQMETITMENKILDTGDVQSYKRIYPHLSEQDIQKMISKRRRDKMAQAKFDAKVKANQYNEFKEETGVPPDDKAFKSFEGKVCDGSSGSSKGDKVEESKIDNRAAHSNDSSKQSNKNGDQRQ